MANTDDLRYIRTEKAMRAAFMDLVREGSVASVTASAVCRRAGISRNAFYLHHASVSELYAALVGELVDDVREKCLESSEKVITSKLADADFELAIIKALAAHEGLLRALLPVDDGSLAKCLAEGLESSFIEAGLSFGPHGASPAHRLRCAYPAWATIGFVSRWIQQTDDSLLEAVEALRELHDGATESSVRFLLGGTSPLP